MVKQEDAHCVRVPDVDPPGCQLPGRQSRSAGAKKVMLAPRDSDAAAIRTLAMPAQPGSSKYDRLIAKAKSASVARTVVVHPCDETSLRGPIEAAETGIIVPVLVGPAAEDPRRQRLIADVLADFERLLGDTTHPHSIEPLANAPDRGLTGPQGKTRNRGQKKPKQDKQKAAAPASALAPSGEGSHPTRPAGSKK
jgi:hypothetical protein